MWHRADVEIRSYEHCDLPVMDVGCDEPDRAGKGNLSQELQRPLPFQKHEIEFLLYLSLTEKNPTESPTAK